VQSTLLDVFDHVSRVLVPWPIRLSERRDTPRPAVGDARAPA
jgi:hypothetical protein